MAFQARIDKINNYDYELEERLREQEERKFEEHIQSLKEKYPRDILRDDFVLRCKLYIPAYKDIADCLITRRYIQVDHYEYINGKECFFRAMSYFGYENPERYDCWANPEEFNNRTRQMNPVIAEALGYAISYGIYELRGIASEKLQCEQKVNNLLRSRSISFNGLKFFFYKKGDINNDIPLYNLASEGIDLDEPFFDEEDTTVFRKNDKIPVPYENISYVGRKYVVVPYQYGSCFFCITDNVIMALSIEEETFILDSSKKNIVIKVELRDPFAKKIMNRKDSFEQLKDDARYFYYNAFKEADKLNTFFQQNSCRDYVRKELIETIENGILGKKMSANSLSNKMQKLSGKQYSCDFQRIVCNGKESTLYQYCKDVYEQ